MTDDKYRTAVDAAAIYSETDLRGTITHINDQFCTISGYSRDELIGANHRILNSGQHPPEFSAISGEPFPAVESGKARSATAARMGRCTG